MQLYIFYINMKKHFVDRQIIITEIQICVLDVNKPLTASEKSAVFKTKTNR